MIPGILLNKLSSLLLLSILIESKKFPPGHRIRIKQFVDSVRQSKKIVLGKRQYTGRRHKESKKQRMSSTGTSDASDLTDSIKGKAPEDTEQWDFVCSNCVQSFFSFM